MLVSSAIVADEHEILVWLMLNMAIATTYPRSNRISRVLPAKLEQIHARPAAAAQPLAFFKYPFKCFALPKLSPTILKYEHNRILAPRHPVLTTLRADPYQLLDVSERAITLMATASYNLSCIDFNF